jgi:hypothetical protein
MADEKQLAILRQGTEAWEAWRRENLDVAHPDLYEADLGGTYLGGAYLGEADLRGANLRGTDLRKALLGEADLRGANLGGADLRGAYLRGTDLREANLGEAHLDGADLFRAHLGGADLRGANLAGVNLQSASLVNTRLANANLTGCRVYGLSAWDLDLDGATQKDLIITRDEQPEITVDDLEVAQFVYLLLNNQKIRDVIDTIGKKGVLLLGRFTGGRLAVLERLRDELRRRNFLPMVFNFDKPETKDFTETVRLLAGLSSFVIADITNPRSTPLELQATVPEYMVPFVTVLEEGEEPFAMFQDLWVKHRDWVFAPVSYAGVDELAQGLDVLIKRAQVRSAELVARKSERVRVERIQDLQGDAAL